METRPAFQPDILQRNIELGDRKKSVPFFGLGPAFWGSVSSEEENLLRLFILLVLPGCPDWRRVVLPPCSDGGRQLE